MGGSSGKQSGSPDQPAKDGEGQPTSGMTVGSSSGSGSLSNPVKPGNNKVQLAVSVLGGVPGLTAYHSSVVVNDEEFFFSDGGVANTRGLASHRNPQMKDNVPKVIDMGMSQYSGSQLKAALEKHFLPGTYDLLRKNCNSFTDCALFFLLHKRLDKSYRALEQIGASNPGMLQSLSQGQYQPNPKAENFDLEKLIKDIDPEKVWTTPGQAVGGSAATSAEAMRAARLAKLGGGGGGAGPAAASAPSSAPPPSTVDTSQNAPL
mmetsp:Transcript_44682/g.106018  ORF Transcript_44682/g.106018 Transcript_44682/m.106018 type:complete len:262 (-) Transcript_44682:183-968(-)|eukprot:CAMPEP_0178410718 /NCGR_PEP_ID=MMETSP0689_2-20121128/21128_1 /TAXON_ID=160604 /ORGANISM="Amphidinium massartii, Strain CS-259" /LENGTH=261 /DNA_ID=CAMNT_0020031911 /DNA_START=44 /DNA_END=829 /DNA_ORIENTATION=-